MWQEGSLYAICAAYSIIGLFALVGALGRRSLPASLRIKKVPPTVSVQIQLVRIQRRVPEYGWTTQKVRGSSRT